MNVKLLNEVKKAIKKYPERFQMSDWIDINDYSAPCGTTACIAGWTCILHRQKEAGDDWIAAAQDVLQNDSKIHSNIEYDAATLLALNPSQAKRLFFVSRWPSTFATDYDRMPITLSLQKLRERKAKIVVERIDHFIKTEGRE